VLVPVDWLPVGGAPNGLFCRAGLRDGLPTRYPGNLVQGRLIGT